jgi:hypothetical protein
MTPTCTRAPYRGSSVRLGECNLIFLADNLSLSLLSPDVARLLLEFKQSEIFLSDKVTMTMAIRERCQVRIYPFVKCNDVAEDQILYVCIHI